MAKKKTPSMAAVLDQLEQAYDHAIAVFPVEARKVLRKHRPVILVQTRGRSRNTLGWHDPDRWKRGKDAANEITIAAEHLTNGMMDVLRTLVHEMVHFSNHHMGVRDTSSNGYHNKKFKESAEAVGLNVVKCQTGFGCTPTVTEELAEVMQSWPLDEKVFALHRKERKAKDRPGSKLKKYMCGCGYGIRIAVDPEQIDLTCGICGETVEEA